MKSTYDKAKVVPGLFESVKKGVLSGQIDRYNGIKIQAQDIESSTSPESFKSTLIATIEEYKR